MTLGDVSRWSSLGHDVLLLVPTLLSPLLVTFSIPPKPGSCVLRETHIKCRLASSPRTEMLPQQGNH